MADRITSWLNVDEASAIGSAAQELLGKSASQALEVSSRRMRQWAVQLVRRVALPDSNLRCSSPKGGSNEIFTKLAGSLAIPLLRAVSTASTASSEKAEIFQVLHQFPAAVVIPAILAQAELTPSQRCAELTQFMLAVASAHRATDINQSADASTEIVVECVASVFDSARSLSQDATNGRQGGSSSPPASPARLTSPGQIGQSEAPAADATSEASSAELQAQNRELVDLLAKKLHRWLLILCDANAVEPVSGGAASRWVRAVQIALEKTFALASDGISLRLLGAALGGGEAENGTAIKTEKFELPLEARHAILERCRLQMRGQPKLTLELLQEDDRLQAKAAQPKVGAKYKVLLRATVRETVDTSSSRIRALSVGDVVTVAEHAVHEATGQSRVLLTEDNGGGWTSMVAQDGRPILTPVDDSTELAPSLVQSLLFERLRPLLVLRMMPVDIVDDVATSNTTLNADEGEGGGVAELLGERLTKPLEFDQVRKLGAEVFGQIVTLPSVLASCAATLTSIRDSHGSITGDDVLGAKAWVYSTCTAIGLWRSQGTPLKGKDTAACVESVVDCLLGVLQAGAPVPAPGSEDLSEEEKLSRGCTDAIAALLCALCASTNEDVAAVGRSVLDHLISQLSSPGADAAAAFTWSERAIPVLQVFKTVGLMLNSVNQPRAAQIDPSSDGNQEPPRDTGAQTVLLDSFGPIVELAGCGIAPINAIEELDDDDDDDEKEAEDRNRADCDVTDQLLLLRPAALQLVFSIVLQLKSDVFAGAMRALIFDLCEAACCADDELSRLRGAQLAGAIMCVPRLP
jgi:hypothetical protein